MLVLPVDLFVLQNFTRRYYYICDIVSNEGKLNATETCSRSRIYIRDIKCICSFFFTKEKIIYLSDKKPLKCLSLILDFLLSCCFKSLYIKTMNLVPAKWFFVKLWYTVRDIDISLPTNSDNCKLQYPKKVKGQLTIFQIIEHHTSLKDVIRCVIKMFWNSDNNYVITVSTRMWQTFWVDS